MIESKILDFEDTRVAFAGRSALELRRAYWLFRLLSVQWLADLGQSVLMFALKLRLPVEGIILRTIFRHFCGGESITGCRPCVEALGSFGVKTILDYSVEGKSSEADFESSVAEILATVEEAGRNQMIPLAVFKVTGLASFGLLEKVHSAAELNEDEQAAWQRVITRVEAVCAAAAKVQIPVLIDAEESWVQDAIDDLSRVMMRKFNQDRAIVFNTVQMYRVDRLAFVKSEVALAQKGGYHFGVKLVRGAYMEKERERAAQRGYPSPIQPTKDACDNDYDAAVAFLMENIKVSALCAGSHNEKSNENLAQLMKAQGVQPSDDRVFFSQLLGMSDHISYTLAKAGYNVAKYVPYGPVREVIPYLIRRAEENSSITGQTTRELTLLLRELKRRAEGGAD
ncbi:MAG: proline dehydrogenase [Deltaproteobacteria bacterium]|jgi:proline dehydrogenase|nr:proline dehydrogenase [Deltaproteobacteria bacterium]MBT6432017.1 proline dehydrogenase [Deltaproteobacteria bacterium]MBT6490805.1 proline dehydrogenase [Deltaproteobacteria bacterium]